MGTVIYFVELALMSLIGIMFYRLYLSYKSWKTASVFSAKQVSTKTFERSNSALSRSSSELDAAKLLLDVNNSGYLAADKISVTEAVPDRFVHEGKSSAILNDYIGEFFSGAEAEAIDIESYRTSADGLVKSSNEEGFLAETKADTSLDEDYITVESTQLIFSDVSQAPLSLLEKDELGLKGHSEMETDSFITVMPGHDQEKANHKMMSDKVVLAMLDEAKLVRAC